MSSPIVTGLPPLIPRAILFGNPKRSSPQLSPDGTRLAYIAPDERDVLQVWVRTVGADDDRAVTNDDKRGIRSYFWAYNGRQIVYVQDKDGDEDFHLYAVDLDAGETRDLTPFPQIQAQLVAREPAFPDDLLVGLNKDDARKHDVYRLDLRTGALRKVADNPGAVADWTADSQLRVRAALEVTPDGGTNLLVRDDEASDWRLAKRFGPDDEGSVIGFAGDDETLYLTSTLDANTARLVALNLRTGEEHVIAEDPTYDVGGVLTHPTTHALQAVAFYRATLEWQPLDPAVAADFAAIAQIRPGQFSVVNRNLADTTWLVAVTTDNGPVYYYAFDRAAKGATFLFTHQPALEGLPLASMRPIQYVARDGLTIHGYLTLPVGVEPRNLPTVLLVHGGPWARDTWGYSSLVQWLANRGYAVLQINFRGSTGYGKAFVNAGDREWGRAMQDDLTDAVAWIVAQGVADPKRVAIMGGSYGGYATLAGLAFTPDLYAAGVDIVGPSNILTLLASIPAYWEAARASLIKRVGDPMTDEAMLRERSPVNFADRMRAPLLIGQGANDPRVKQAESEQIVAAMRAAGRTVEYVVYEDEGHGFARPENNQHFFMQVERFLATHLGGRAEPATDIPGASASFR